LNSIIAMLNSSLDVVPQNFSFRKKSLQRLPPMGKDCFCQSGTASFPVKSALPACLADRGPHFNWKDESRSAGLLLEIPDNYLFLAHSAPGGAVVLFGDGTAAGRADVADASPLFLAHQWALRAFGHDKDHVVSVVDEGLGAKRQREGGFPGNSRPTPHRPGQWVAQSWPGNGRTGF